MLNPKYITYVVDSNMMAGDKSGLLEALNYASNIVDKHGLQTKFNIKLLFDIQCDTPYELIYKIKGIPRICAVDLLPYNCGQQTNVLHRFLMQKSSQKFTAIEINETALSDFLQSANYVAEDEKTANKRKLPVYRFDAITRSFITGDDSAFLEYVKILRFFLWKICIPQKEDFFKNQSRIYILHIKRHGSSIPDKRKNSVYQIRTLAALRGRSCVRRFRSSVK